MVESVALISMFQNIIVIDFYIEMFFQEPGELISDGTGASSNGANAIFSADFAGDLFTAIIFIAPICFGLGQDFEHFSGSSSLASKHLNAT